MYGYEGFVRDYAQRKAVEDAVAEKAKNAPKLTNDWNDWNKLHGEVVAKHAGEEAKRKAEAAAANPVKIGFDPTKRYGGAVVPEQPKSERDVEAEFKRTDSVGVIGGDGSALGFGQFGNGLAAKFDAQRPLVSASAGGMSEEQQAMLKKVLTPHKGAQNGQLTANQLNAARGIIGDTEKNQLAVAQQQAQLAQQAALSEQNNQAAMQREAVKLAAQQQENVAARADADKKFQTELGFKRQAADMAKAQNALQMEESAMKLGALKQQEQLTKAYQQAGSDADRLAIAKQIGALNGNFDVNQKQEGFSPDVFKVISQEMPDPQTGMPMKRDVIVDLRTGQALNIKGTGGGADIPAGWEDTGETQRGFKVVKNKETGKRMVLEPDA